MSKTQKVKFHRGDRRPNNEQPELSYIKKMKNFYVKQYDGYTKKRFTSKKFYYHI